MNNVIVVIGPGSIGQAIAQRVSAGKHVVLADLRPENAASAAKVLSDAGFDVSTATVDVAFRTSVQDEVRKSFKMDDRSYPSFVETHGGESDTNEPAA